jgi:transcriptional regulatory protein LevR
MALYVDFKDPLIKQKIQELPPTKGYCILVDIVSSTKLKKLPIEEWALPLKHCCRYFSSVFHPWLKKFFVG